MLTDLDDRSLVRRAQDGCTAAFGELARRHSAMTYRVALRMLGNHHDAQDIMQESLLSAWRNLERFRGDSAFSTWLYRIVARRALNRLTRGKVDRSLDLLDDVPADGRSDPQVLYERRTIVDAVTVAVAGLPLPQRTVVVLHHLEGLSYDDVAEVTHCSAASVRSHLFRARRALAGVLAEEPVLDG